MRESRLYFKENSDEYYFFILQTDVRVQCFYPVYSNILSKLN